MFLRWPHRHRVDRQKKDILNGSGRASLMARLVLSVPRVLTCIVGVPHVFCTRRPDACRPACLYYSSEASFLLLHARKKKLTVCPDVRLILVLVWKNCLCFCVGYVLYGQPVQQYKHHVVRSIAGSGVSPAGARSDGHHWCQAARTAATCT